MKPPFQITTHILSVCTEIVHLLGQTEGLRIYNKPEPKLRKSNRIKTIQGSLAIEGNTLNIEQITAILDGKRVSAPTKEILEVQNAIHAYSQMERYKPYSEKSLKEAHRLLMRNLLQDAGSWRVGNVGVLKGDHVAHTAPQAKRVPELMEQLFLYAKNDKETHPLILSSIVHYEIEFIHPFSDGNGRVGRLWQTLLLSKFHPLFEFTPVESVIKNRQNEYYKSLSKADKLGEVTPFIEFSLSTILSAFEELVAGLRPSPMTAESRIEQAREEFKTQIFSRKDYLNFFKTISTATASRDLQWGVEKNILRKTGDRAMTRYHFS